MDCSPQGAGHKQAYGDMYLKALWKGKQLTWYYSGRYWYCTCSSKKSTAKKWPVGSGDSKDEAFLNFKYLLAH